MGAAHNVIVVGDLAAAAAATTKRFGIGWLLLENANKLAVSKAHFRFLPQAAKPQIQLATERGESDWQAARFPVRLSSLLFPCLFSPLCWREQFPKPGRTFIRRRRRR